jgi:hypothetical protein
MSGDEPPPTIFSVAQDIQDLKERHNYLGQKVIDLATVIQSQNECIQLLAQSVRALVDLTLQRNS